MGKFGMPGMKKYVRIFFRKRGNEAPKWGADLKWRQWLRITNISPLLLITCFLCHFVKLIEQRHAEFHLTRTARMLEEDALAVSLYHNNVKDRYAHGECKMKRIFN